MVSDTFICMSGSVDVSECEEGRLDGVCGNLLSGAGDVWCVLWHKVLNLRNTSVSEVSDIIKTREKIEAG